MQNAETKIILPPPGIFANRRMGLVEKMAGGESGSTSWEYTYADPINGGVYVHYKDRPEHKGHMYPAACDANNQVKKVNLLLLSLLKPKTFLYNYIRFADYVNHQHYLKYIFYSDCNREMWDFTFLFMRKLGFSFQNSYDMGRIMANLFEYETAYRWHMQAFMGEIISINIKHYPRKEIKRVAKLFTTYTWHDKITMMAKMFSYLLLVPKIKKAFVFALENIDLTQFTMDLDDRFYAYGLQYTKS